ncbi:MAG: sensor histidine kinase [Candidatus Kerfeldbacteria bacterium]
MSSYLIIFLLIIIAVLVYLIVRLKKQVRTIELNEIKKMEGRRSGFISIISHQMRTPLSIIKGFLESLSDGDLGEMKPEQKDYVDDALKINLETILLINDYLSAVRLDSEKIEVNPSSGNLIEISKDSVDKLKILAKAYNCELNFVEPEQNLVEVVVDKIKVKQVVENIIVNAIKYTSGKGSATISLENKEEFIIFHCKDTGVGIPSDQIKELFTKFFRATNVIQKDTKGSGLGLFFAKSIIESLGGEIWVDSVENKGTTVSFKLPKYKLNK